MKPTQQPGKRKLWRKAVLGFAAILAILLLIHIGTSYYYQRQLQALLDQLTADDPNWGWEAYRNAHSAIAPKDNAAHEIVELLKLTTLRETIPLVKRSEWGKAFSQLYQQHSFEHYELFLELHPNARMPSSMQDKMKPLMAMAPMGEVLPRARLLRHYQTGWFQHTFKPMLMMSLLPDVQGTRSIGNLLAWDADLQMLDKIPTVAIESIQGMLGIARSYEHDPFMISHLVRLAITGQASRQTMRLLALSSSWTPQQLHVLQAEFERELELSRNAMETMMKSERAVFDHDMTQLIDGKFTLLERNRLMGRGVRWSSGNSRIDEIVINAFPEIILGWGNRPGNYMKERYELLTFFTKAVKWSRLPEHELFPEVENWSKQGPFVTPFIREYFFLLAMSSGSSKDKPPEFGILRRMAYAYLTQRAKLRCIITALAAERYRIKEGRWPATMESLVPGYLKQSPIDPFNGKPLAMKPFPDGIAIYSVGRDGQDSGGEVLYTQDAQPKDLGYRLWNPAQRSVSLDEQCNEFVKTKKAE